MAYDSKDFPWVLQILPQFAKSQRGDLVVIANRLPVHRTSPESPWETSPGGLVSRSCPSYVKIKVYGSVGRESR